jgi:hypothetical protein
MHAHRRKDRGGQPKLTTLKVLIWTDERTPRNSGKAQARRKGKALPPLREAQVLSWADQHQG